ncbi:MAG: hypothetical protein ABL908_14420 [Hyphomicrobium sp.]
MSSTTTVRSWPAIGLGVFFASVTAYVLFKDVTDGAAINTSHVLSLAALVAAIASGHMVWPAAKAGRIVTALMLMVLFLAATGYVVVSSGARNAETAGAKAASVETVAKTRAEIEKMHREANIILGSCAAGTPKEHVGIRCGLRDAMTKECATGKGKACDGKSYSVTTYDAALEGYDKRLAKLGPATAPNGGYAHAAKVLAALPGVTAAAADIEARLVLILPFLTVLIAELGTITFLHLGMGHQERPEPLPPKAAPIAPPVVTGDDVVSWVKAFEARHGRKPQIPELQAGFRRKDGTTVPKTTAWRKINAA